MSIQLENGFTKIANELIEQLARIRIPGVAMQVFWVMLRKIYGFNKKSDAIALSQISAGTGLTKIAVCKAVRKLTKLNLITKKGNSAAVEYAINKHFGTWKPLPKKVTLPKKVMGITKKGNLPLPKMDTTKETITKETFTKETKAKKPPPQTEIPESLNTSQFIEAWHLWLQHRKEIRKPVTPTSTREQLKKLADIGVDRATAAIMHSIQKGYQGIFENRNSESMRGSQAEAYEALKNFKIMEDDQNENTD